MLLLKPFLWLVLSFTIGIGLFFLWPHEPEIKWFLLGIACITLLIIYLKLQRICFVALACLLALGGFTYADYRTDQISYHPVPPDLGIVNIRAQIKQMEPQIHGYRLWLTHNNIWDYDLKKVLPHKYTPEVIRLNVRTKVANGILPGDYIQVRAALTPPSPRPVYPGGYQFARYAFFQSIGAVGYSVSDVRQFKAPEELTRTFLHQVHATRLSLSEHLSELLPKDRASIASALLTGIRGHIPDTIVENMRIAGLGHLLAISGLHMAIVMSGCYFLLRIILAAIPYTALHAPTKQIAAIGALLLGVCYLTLTGFPVSAIRAYLMVGMFFVALLLNRLNEPLRPVAWAAVIILLLDPSSLITPGFQMSFSAVIALVAVYAYLRDKRAKKGFIQRSWKQKTLLYIGAILMTSFIAGTATTPIALYHFGRLTHYNLLANLAGIPLTSLWILPSGMLGLIVQPLGLGDVPFTIMGYGIACLNQVAAWTAGLPHAYHLIPHIPLWAVLSLYAGAMSLLLLQKYKKPAATSFCTIGLAGFLFLPEAPDIIIDETGGLIALKTTDGQLAFSSLITSRFARSQWLEANGLKESLRIKDLTDEDLQGFVCNPSSCTRGEITLRFKQDPVLVSSDRVIRLADLQEKGTHLIRLDTPLKVLTVADKLPQRLWTAESLPIKTNSDGK